MRLTQGDLAAANIMRGREIGVADYNRVRGAYGLGKIKEWKDVNPALYARKPKVCLTKPFMPFSDIGTLEWE